MSFQPFNQPPIATGESKEGFMAWLREQIGHSTGTSTDAVSSAVPFLE